MKKRVSLDVFEELLPTLQAKHADASALQKAIDDGYEIFETKDGKETPVHFRVRQGEKPAEPVDLKAMVKSEVAEAVKAATPKSQPPAQIEVKEPSFLPDGLKLYKPIRSFAGTDEQKRLKAYSFGVWFLGSVMGMSKYAEKSASLGIPIIKAHAEGTNTTGGYLVPDVLENYIIDLREQYGVFRQNARVTPMVRDTQDVPRRVSGLTAYFKDEAAALAESTKAWNSVGLVAKKLTALAKISSELMEDAIINVGDDLASEIVYAFSLKEDQCGFIGDKTSTYGGITGVNVALKAAAGTPTTTSAGGVTVGAGNALSEITLANYNDVVGRLPQYADNNNAKWFTSRWVWANSMQRLAEAAGGATVTEIVNGIRTPRFLGYPVVISQVFPTSDANSQIVAILGDLSLAATFGDRRQTVISVSDQVYWANDQVGIKGTERFDIVVHDVGDSSTAGPIVGLQSLNS